MSIRIFPYFPNGNWDALRQFLADLCRRGTDSSVDRVLKHKLANTTEPAAISNTASQTFFTATETISLSLFQPGRIFRVIARGAYSTTGTPTLNIRLWFGDNVITSSGVINAGTNASNLGWRIEAECVVKSLDPTDGAYGVFGGINHRALTSSTTSTVVTNSAPGTTVALTNAPTNVQVSAQWGTADSANTITMTDLIVFLSDY